MRQIIVEGKHIKNEKIKIKITTPENGKKRRKMGPFFFSFKRAQKKKKKKKRKGKRKKKEKKFGHALNWQKSNFFSRCPDSLHFWNSCDFIIIIEYIYI